MVMVCNICLEFKCPRCVVSIRIRMSMRSTSSRLFQALHSILITIWLLNITSIPWRCLLAFDVVHERATSPVSVTAVPRESIVGLLYKQQGDGASVTDSQKDKSADKGPVKGDVRVDSRRTWQWRHFKCLLSHVPEIGGVLYQKNESCDPDTRSLYGKLVLRAPDRGGNPQFKIWNLGEPLRRLPQSNVGVWSSWLFL